MTCAFCSQPEGHTGVCGASKPTRPAPKLVGRPKLAKFENGLIAQLALFDDATLQVWWLRYGVWRRGMLLLEPLWQVETKTNTAHVAVTMTARLGHIETCHKGYFLNRHDAAEILRKHPSPLEPTREENTAMQRRIDEAADAAAGAEADERARVSE